jgi:polar amino acid transport system permease protein
MTPFLFLLLVKAALYTVFISAISIALGVSLGLGVAAARASNNPLLSWPARAYVSFFRGVPLLVQLLLIYNLLPVIGINVPSVVAAISGLTLCTSAYQAENLRGGFASVPKGLLESADMLGLTPWRQLVRIRAPIAFRLTLPAVTNEAILILKASSLVSVVGVVELTRMAQDLDTSLFKPIQLYSTAGLLYFIINRGVAGFGRYAERRLSWGLRGGSTMGSSSPNCPTSSRRSA